MLGVEGDGKTGIWPPQGQELLFFSPPSFSRHTGRRLQLGGLTQRWPHSQVCGFLTCNLLIFKKKSVKVLALANFPKVFAHNARALFQGYCKRPPPYPILNFLNTRTLVARGNWGEGGRLEAKERSEKDKEGMGTIEGRRKKKDQTDDCNSQEPEGRVSKF